MILGIQSLFVLSQNPKIITGKICEKDSLPIIGTNIMIKGTTIGTISDLEGNYNISIPDSLDSFVLQYSFIGYFIKEVQFTRDSIDSEKFLIKLLSDGKK